jgi:hypothetical protein
MKSNKKNSAIFFIFALIIAALIILGAWPLKDGIKKDSEDFVSAKNEVSTFESQINEIENFKNSYETYKGNLEKMDQLFVDSENPVGFIKFLENAASDSNINLQISILPYSGNEEPSLSFIFFQLFPKGKFDDILSFINKVEFGSYLVEINSLTIENQKENSSIKKDNNTPRENTGVINIKVFAKR